MLTRLVSFTAVTIAAFLLSTSRGHAQSNFALQFDGVNDFVTFGRTNALGASNFTIEVRFKRTGTGISTSTGTGGTTAVPLITKGRGEADGSNLDMNYFLGISNTVLAVDFEGYASGSNFPLTGVTAITNGGWYHAAATCSGGVLSVYLNGVLDASRSVAEIPRYDSIQHAGLGTAMTSSGVTVGAFLGQLDEARVWNYARSAAQILATINTPITNATGLIGRWGLDEGTGTTAGDTSGNNVSGILSNGPVWVNLTPVNTNLIVVGDTWRYFKGTSYPTGWETNGFNDTGWLTGPSGFGYGDGDDATLLADMTNTVGGYVSVFTRREFVVPTNSGAIGSMTLGANFDDGFVAWINGIEVTRQSMVPGPISNTTTGLDHEAGTRITIPITNNFTSLLRPGNPSTNLIAVSGHNQAQNSSDLSLIIDLSYAIASTSGVVLTRGPFIQMPDTNGMTIVWRTSTASDSVVDYGLDTGYSAGTVSNASLVTEHVIKLTGLQAGTNYFYRVRSGGQILSSNVFFRTPRLPSQSWRTVVLGDFGQGTVGMSNVANQINARDFDLFLTVGDNIYPNGEDYLYDPYWFSLYKTSMQRTPCMPTVGNHDILTSSGQPFLDFFYLPTNGPASYLEKNYSFDYANAHFCAADSNPFANNQTSAMTAIKTWVSNDLAATTQQWKIVYFHHPPYTSDGNGSHGDNQSVKTNLLNVVEAVGADLVMVGHNHFYERINAINGVYHLITGAGGASLTAPNNQKIYSASLVINVNSFALLEINGPQLKLWGINGSGATVDTFSLDKSVPFKIDGLLDNAGWQRAVNGLKLHAAIRGNFLYLATQDAGEGSDHFLYLASQLSTNRPANWSKAGTVMQWSAFLADENNNGFVGWYNHNDQPLTNDAIHRAMTSGLNNNGASSNGVLEGTIQLATHFGTFPQQLYIAAAPYGTSNAQALVTASQVPATGDGNGNIESNEFLALNPRDIALDLPVANAGTNYTIEAGLTAPLNGTASAAPSGLPLSYDWTILTGLPAVLTGSNNATASFLATNAGVRTVQLAVNDTRFTSNATVTVTVTAPVDTDGDGLTDAEETTGIDNVTTIANPNGILSNPNAADTDGDGSNDGDEALAGTNPNSAASVLKISTTGTITGGYRVQWDTVAGKSYIVEMKDELTNTWSTLGNVTATGSTTNYLDSGAAGQPKRFYRIRLAP